MPRVVKALLLAAGKGTRLRPLTDTLPKCLVPVGGRPLLDYWVDRLAEAGVTEARVNTHSHAEQVRDYVAAVNRSGRLRLVESYEPELLGSAGTVARNADLADGADDVLIVYADNFSDVDLRPLLAYHRGHGDPFTMLLFRAPDPRACGIAELDAAGRVVSFVEKPNEPKGDLANAGVYAVSPTAYREVAAQNAFDLGFDVLPRFTGRMRGWLWGGYHLDVGTPAALEKARRDAPSFAALPPVPPGAARPAVFLDRDGTLIEHVHHLNDPAQVRALPGAAKALRRLRAAGYVLVVVTNQSVIGRGLLTEEGLQKIHTEMDRQLAAEGGAVDAVYFCPDPPGVDDRTVIERGERKPGPGMLTRAAAERNLDLKASWMVGDMVSDLLAGTHAGCLGSVLVRTGKGLTPSEEGAAAPYPAVADLAAAADLVLGRSATGPDAAGG